MEEYIYFFQPYHLSRSPAPFGGGRQTYTLADFFVRNLMPKNFYLKLFSE